MSIFKWRDKYVKKVQGQFFEHEKLVDPLGFIPHNQKIENYNQAGIRLQKSRIEQYDGDMNVDPKDIPYNPYRDRGMDFADVERSKRLLEMRINASKERHEKAIKEEKERVEKMAKNDTTGSVKKEPETKIEGGTSDTN